MIFRVVAFLLVCMLWPFWTAARCVYAALDRLRSWLMSFVKFKTGERMCHGKQMKFKAVTTGEDTQYFWRCDICERKIETGL